MHIVRIYIDEEFDKQRVSEFLMAMSHVVDVETGKNDAHELVIEYEENHDMPKIIIEALRNEGFHPDILSA